MSSELVVRASRSCLVSVRAVLWLQIRLLVAWTGCYRKVSWNLEWAWMVWCLGSLGIQLQTSSTKIQIGKWALSKHHTIHANSKYQLTFLVPLRGRNIYVIWGPISSQYIAFVTFVNCALTPLTVRSPAVYKLYTRRGSATNAAASCSCQNRRSFVL